MLTKELIGPLPNDVLGERIVIASVIYREADDEIPQDIYLVLLLNKEPPFFTISHVHWPTVQYDWISSHYNIVPAVEEYKQSGGDY